MFLCHPSETTKPLNFITAFLWELRSEETNPTWKDNVCHYPADEARQSRSVIRFTGHKASWSTTCSAGKASTADKGAGRETRKHTRGSISSWGFMHFKSITGRTHNHSVPSSSPLRLDSGFWIIFIVFVIKIFLNSLHLNIFLCILFYFSESHLEINLLSQSDIYYDQSPIKQFL